MYFPKRKYKLFCNMGVISCNTEWLTKEYYQILRENLEDKSAEDNSFR